MEHTRRQGVNRQWVFRFPYADAVRLAGLANTKQVSLLADGPFVWLRGEASGRMSDEELLRLFPGERPFWIGDDGLLTRLGDRVPVGKLPSGKWLAWNEWFTWRLPPARDFEGPASDRRKFGQPQITLVRGGPERPATMLRTQISTWCEYVDWAPQWRLNQWAYVASHRGEVMVRGEPLPPIRGQRWTVSDGIALPAGWQLCPQLQPHVLRAAWSLAEGDWAIIEPSADTGLQWERIPADCWIKVTRASVRALQ